MRRIPVRIQLSRIKHPLSDWRGDAYNGAFRIEAPSGRKLNVLASNGGGWDHVSVSVYGTDETPTWDEMCWVKQQFFNPEETVIQYHPPESKYINFDAGCLHLWRPQNEVIPMPPLVMV